MRAACPLSFFFFQAEDGIRDLTVTGVQTCALPISARADARGDGGGRRALRDARPTLPRRSAARRDRHPARPAVRANRDLHRSEEHTSELQSQSNLVCRLLLEKKKQAAETYDACHLS